MWNRTIARQGSNGHARLMRGVVGLCTFCAAQVAIGDRASEAVEDRNVASAELGAAALADTEDFVESGYIERKTGQIKFINDGETVASSSGAGRWFSVPGAPHPHWVWVRFRQPARIHKVVLHRGRPDYYPVAYSGQYSPDGGLTFQPLFTITDNTMDDDTPAVEHAFAPVVTDNFRLWIDRSSSQEFPAETELSEIEVFGTFVETGAESTFAPPQPSPAEVFEPTLAPTPDHHLLIDHTPEEVQFRSPWLRLCVARDRPQITSLCWDSLGEGKLDTNLLRAGAADGAQFGLTPLFSPLQRAEPEPADRVGNAVRWKLRFPGGITGLLEVRARTKAVDIAVSWATNGQAVVRMPVALKAVFDTKRTFVAPLANPGPGDPAPLPCLLHAADYGSLLVQMTDGSPGSVQAKGHWFDKVDLTFVANRNRRADGLHVLPGGVHRSGMTLTVESVKPLPALVDSDERLRFLPRHWLNGFQYRADWGVLSNNVVSANAIFCMYTFTDPAPFTPPLPGQIEAIDVARESVDRYLNGFGGYGQDPAYYPEIYPALLISAWNVILVTGDLDLLQRWLPKLEEMADHSIRQDRNGNGLPESIRAGNRPSPREPAWRSGNWWDCINFGHEDAFACGLAYRALRCTADLERLAKRRERVERYDAAADRIREAYVPTFLNPETGILAGWKSQDGALHDYWFVFVNGMAIDYGLVPDDVAHQILDRFQAKFKDVGYTRFDLGLPGNLVPIPQDEYAPPEALGAPHTEDGSDTFGIFENGGATACHAYFYIEALYRTGRRAEADRILWPVMKTFAMGGFNNGCGRGGEWKSWDGCPTGYEGLLADAYTTQLALIRGYYGIGFGLDGFRLEPWSPLKGQRVKLGLKHMGKIVEAIR
jgi:hypothetical protein